MPWLSPLPPLGALPSPKHWVLSQNILFNLFLILRYNLLGCAGFTKTLSSIFWTLFSLIFYSRGGVMPTPPPPALCQPPPPPPTDRARRKRCRAQKEEKERTKGKESLWLLEAPVRKIILQMHTPVRTSQCWLESANPAWTRSVHLDAPGQRHGQQPVSGTADPGVVKQDKSSRGSVDTTRTRSDPQRVRMSSGERPIGTAKVKQRNTEALCQPPPPPGLVPTPPPPPTDRARRKRCRAQKEEKERTKGKESLWLLEAPVRKIILQMHTPVRTSQCWLESANPAWTRSVHLDAPGQRHGQQPVSGTADPGVVKQDKSSRGSVDTTRTRSDPQRVRMSSGERPIGTAKVKQRNTEALCQPPPPPPPPYLLYQPRRQHYSGGAALRLRVEMTSCV